MVAEVGTGRDGEAHRVIGLGGIEGREFVDDEFREREFLIADGPNDGFREFVAGAKGGDLRSAGIYKEGAGGGRRVEGNADVFDHQPAEFGFDRGVGERWKGDGDTIISFGGHGGGEIERARAFDAHGGGRHGGTGFEAAAAGCGKDCFGSYICADEVGMVFLFDSSGTENAEAGSGMGVELLVDFGVGDVGKVLG